MVHQRQQGARRLAGALCSSAFGVLAFVAQATGQVAAPDAPTTVLFTDVRIFDGKGSTLSGPSHVLVRGNLIERISAEPIPTDRSGRTRIVNGGGRTLIPGLIDAHWHMTMAGVPMNVLLTADIGYLNLVAGREAGNTLRRGFTSVRDLAGPVFGLKRAIDSGVVDGPRIWPSGAMISQTSGHGDFRMPHEIPSPAGAPLSHGEIMGGGVIADSPDEVRKRAREQLMLGASQLKLAAGGGVSSPYDPIDVAQYTEAEIALQRPKTGAPT
jgi:imidazolonepropionase-like amidohydrolase